MDIGKIYRTERLYSWAELMDWYKHGARDGNEPGNTDNNWGSWIFRGQREASWPLKTSLERAVVERFEYSWDDVPEIEEGLVRQFERRLHLYDPSVMADDMSFMEKLALMQHHGAPTRLLDWTYSFFVAVYFAVEAAEPDCPCAVWAMDQKWWEGQAKCRLPYPARRLLEHDANKKESQTVEELLCHDRAGVFALNPYRLNRRLVIQQGVFLAPGSVTRSFMNNLQEIANQSSDEHLIKFELHCNRKLLREAIERLHRMNMNRATLFPGLDGFAQSLEGLIPIPEARAVDRV